MLAERGDVVDTAPPQREDDISQGWLCPRGGAPLPWEADAVRADLHHRIVAPCAALVDADARLGRAHPGGSDWSGRPILLLLLGLV